MSHGDLILWHVSFEKVDNFSPRIPDTIMAGEDEITPRICTATSIKNCLTAMPSGGAALKGLVDSTKKIKGMLAIIHAYCFVTSATDPRVVLPKILKEKYGVLDAEATGEHWITEEVRFEHRVLEIRSAEFTKATDAHGNTGYLIDSIDYELVKIEPNNTFAHVFRSSKELNHIDVRQALKTICEEWKEVVF